MFRMFIICCVLMCCNFSLSEYCFLFGWTPLDMESRENSCGGGAGILLFRFFIIEFENVLLKCALVLEKCN